MRKRGYKGYRGYKGRRHVGAAPLLAAAVLLLGTVAGLYFGGVFPRLRTLLLHRQVTEQTAPDGRGADGADLDRPDSQPEQSPAPQPEEAGYAVIALSGKQQDCGTLCLVGNTGYEYFTYLPELGQKYAAAVTDTAERLRGAATVYDLTVPLSSCVTLPDALQGSELFGDQKGAMEQLDGMMGRSVRTVSLYDALMRHRSEYIYFRTDHHWTALGAYYAYGQFCQTKGIAPHPLTDYAKDEYPGFLGSFYRDSNQNPALGDTPDTVEAYHPLSTQAQLVYTDPKGQEVHWQVIHDVTDYPADLKYSCFIGSDNPYTVIRNPDLTDGSSCVVIKESFGNAFVPYLVDHYQTVHVIDYRYWEGSLTEFVGKNGVQDVIFLNNLSAIRSSYLMGKLQGIL